VAKAGGHAHAHGLVLVLLPDHFCDRGLCVEEDSVVQACGGDVGDDGADCGGLVADGLRLEVYVAGGSSFAEHSEQHAALEHQPIAVRSCGHAGEERCQHVQLHQLIDRAAALSRSLAQVKVRASGRGAPRRRGHSSTSSACRRAGSARGSRRATSMSCAGLRPGWASHRRSACHAMSLPSRWRSRTTSTMERSAE
jgi:hypothetical protein